MKGILIVLFGLFTWNTLYSQSTKPAKQEVVVIQTSAQCGDCKTRIEGGLNYTKGVKYAELDMTTKQVTVKYKPKLTNPQALKKIIAATGYDADEVKADPDAIKKLPLCCQPGGMD
jgi:mercuric ion binding protein